MDERSRSEFRPPRPPGRWTGAYPGPAPDPRESLLRGSPRAVLRRLCAGDPLELAPRCAAYLRRQGYLIEPARLLPGALARVAHDAPLRDPAPGLERFLDRSVARATRLLLRRDLEEQRAELPPHAGDLALLRPVSEALGLEPSLVRLAMLHLHSLPRPVRLAFRALVVDGESPIVHASREGLSVGEVLARARLALRVIASAGRPDEAEARAWGRLATPVVEEVGRG